MEFTNNDTQVELKANVAYRLWHYLASEYEIVPGFTPERYEELEKYEIIKDLRSTANEVANFGLKAQLFMI
jgi:hypothetical protein